MEPDPQPPSSSSSSAAAPSPTGGPLPQQSVSAADMASSSPSPFPRPSSVREFEVGLTAHAEGNYSRVHRARHVATGTVVALKVVERAIVQRLVRRAHPNIQNEILQEKAAAERLQLGGRGEAAAAAPLFPRLLATFQDKEALYYVYEWVVGGELWQRLVDVVDGPGASSSSSSAHSPDTLRCPVPVPVDTARSILRELVRAAEHLHAVGLAHRDLKPENILLAGGGEEEMEGPAGASSSSAAAPTSAAAVRVVDFGTAKDLIDPSYNGPSDFVGTPDYMPPEALDRRRGGDGGEGSRDGGPWRGTPTDSLGDLWSIGCIAFRLLAGTTPFRAPSPFLTFERIVAHAPYRRGAGDDVGRGGSSGGGPSPLAPPSDAADPLAFPPGFPSDAEDFVRKLLCPDRYERLGAGAGPEAGWLAREAGVTAPAPAPAPSAASASSSSVQQGRGGGSQSQPRNPSDTLPCRLPRIDHAALLRHPFLAGTSAPSTTTTPSSISWRTDLAVLARDIATALEPMRMSTLRSLLDAGASEPPPADPAAAAWVRLRSLVRSLPPESVHALCHHLALRRTLHAPHILSLFVPTFASLASLRVSLHEGGGGGRRFLLGETSPRDYVGCGVAREGLTRQAADPDSDGGKGGGGISWVRTDHSAWGSPFSLALLADPRMTADPDGLPASRLSVYVAALARLRPRPRALLVFGRLVEEGVADADSSSAARRLLMELLSRVAEESGGATPVVVVGAGWGGAPTGGSGPGSTIPACLWEEERATLPRERTGLQPFSAAWLGGCKAYLCPAWEGEGGGGDGGNGGRGGGAPPAELRWLAADIQVSRSTAQHSFIITDGALPDSGPVVAGGGAPSAGPPSSSSTAPTRLADAAAGGNVRYVVVPAGEGASVPVVPETLRAPNDSDTFQAARRKEVVSHAPREDGGEGGGGQQQKPPRQERAARRAQRAGGGGSSDSSDDEEASRARSAAAVKLLRVPPLAGLRGVGGGAGGAGGGEPVTVPLVKVLQLRVEPGYALVRLEGTGGGAGWGSGTLVEFGSS
jgi:serine/threonine protein kinase